jgi:hypothetical protein
LKDGGNQVEEEKLEKDDIVTEQPTQQEKGTSSVNDYSNEEEAHTGDDIEKKVNSPPAASGELNVYNINVSQGDAILIKGPDFTFLIDVVPYLQKQGVSELDLLLLSHPHADHIG